MSGSATGRATDRQQRSTFAPPPTDHRRHPPRVPRGGRRHPGDQHLQCAQDLAAADYGSRRWATSSTTGRRRRRGARRRDDSLSTDPERPRSSPARWADEADRVDLADVNDPGWRNVTYDELVAAYRDSPAVARRRRRHPDGRDHLRHPQRQGAVRPREGLDEVGAAAAGMILSGTITDASGRTLSGQTAEAFWNSVRHAGRSRSASTAPSARPRCGPVDELARSPTLRLLLPERRAAQRLRRIRRVAEAMAANARVRRTGWSTSSAAAAAPRLRTSPTSRGGARASAAVPVPAPNGRLGWGLEPSTSTDDSLSSTSASAPTSPARRIPPVIKAETTRTALDDRPQQVENGAQVIDINMDEGMLDGEAAMDRFLNSSPPNRTSPKRAGDDRLPSGR